MYKRQKKILVVTQSSKILAESLLNEEHENNDRKKLKDVKRIYSLTYVLPIIGSTTIVIFVIAYVVFKK